MAKIQRNRDPPLKHMLQAVSSAADRSSLPVVAPARDRLEALLRERKLDRTLTTGLPGRQGDDAVTGFGVPALDARLAGGVPRGQLSELIGPVSSGRTSLAWTWLGAATTRGESVAVIDAFDRLDPATAAQCGIDLSRLLWVRGQAITKTAGAVDPAWLPGARTVEGPGTLLERTIDRSIKALNLVLQSGVCTAVVFDVADVPVHGLRRIPITTWLRLQRVIEGTDTACLLVSPVPLTRSAGGITITTGPPSRPEAASAFARATADKSARSRRSSLDPARAEADATSSVRWAGGHDRARRLAGLSITARLSSPRRIVEGTVALETTTRVVQRIVE
jgi:recA bacterial DNA recombination protein